MAKNSTGSDNHLHIMWRDSAWTPMLNPSNILEYFSQSPFYDRTCNNEIIKMQRLKVNQLQNMTGIEYFLIHTQEPIFYVIRKIHRNSPTQTSTICDYYIIDGSIYQAPDLSSVLNSRLLNATHNLSSAFAEVRSYFRYHPSVGYWWQFKNDLSESKAETVPKNEDYGSSFQRNRIDLLLREQAKKYPPKISQPPQAENMQLVENNQTEKKSHSVAEDSKPILSNSSMPPPGKKPKMMMH
ncbi:DgyrCDS7836 [Dimorphilus gyrociliatus]|uniref:Mediator of RNA polymerase II transcription subunit 6 n=1 Tax=Dimorphilus gyrociliatus TaxID=2664684 RepID=A0A7I8VSF8_9ANNE|nr:DgyrCDS7836 [Dimorphilus gyrociliatus]